VNIIVADSNVMGIVETNPTPVGVPDLETIKIDVAGGDNKDNSIVATDSTPIPIEDDGFILIGADGNGLAGCALGSNFVFGTVVNATADVNSITRLGLLAGFLEAAVGAVNRAIATTVAAVESNEDVGIGRVCSVIVGCKPC
jgi:hypothetical protein